MTIILEVINASKMITAHFKCETKQFAKSEAIRLISKQAEAKGQVPAKLKFEDDKLEASNGITCIIHTLQ